jgi:hypothetical protein
VLDAVLGLIVLAMPLLALGSLAAPVITMLSCRTWPAPALVLAVAPFPLVVLWWRAGAAAFDRADATGAAGNAYAGSWFLFAALAAATAAVVLTIRRSRLTPGRSLPAHR